MSQRADIMRSLLLKQRSDHSVSCSSSEHSDKSEAASPLGMQRSRGVRLAVLALIGTLGIMASMQLGYIFGKMSAKQAVRLPPQPQLHATGSRRPPQQAGCMYVHEVKVLTATWVPERVAAAESICAQLEGAALATPGCSQQLQCSIAQAIDGSKYNTTHLYELFDAGIITTERQWSKQEHSALYPEVPAQSDIYFHLFGKLYDPQTGKRITDEGNATHPTPPTNTSFPSVLHENGRLGSVGSFQAHALLVHQWLEGLGQLPIGSDEDARRFETLKRLAEELQTASGTHANDTGGESSAQLWAPPHDQQAGGGVAASAQLDGAADGSCEPLLLELEADARLDADFVPRINAVLRKLQRERWDGINLFLPPQFPGRKCTEMARHGRVLGNPDDQDALSRPLWYFEAVVGMLWTVRGAQEVMANLPTSVVFDIYVQHLMRTRVLDMLAMCHPAIEHGGKDARRAGLGGVRLGHDNRPDVPDPRKHPTLQDWRAAAQRAARHRGGAA